MKARVVVSDRARADIDAILDDLILNAGLRVAGDYVTSLKALYLRLSSFPDAGAARSWLGRYVRTALWLPYIVVYRHEPNGGVVEILRVLHGSRRISRSLLIEK